jgi:hypothetical protein
LAEKGEHFLRKAEAFVPASNSLASARYCCAKNDGWSAANEYPVTANEYVCRSKPEPLVPIRYVVNQNGYPFFEKWYQFAPSEEAPE